jgi:hypothetical protein
VVEKGFVAEHLIERWVSLEMLPGNPVRIVRVIRRMRGGSQSFLVRGNDGCSYVAKFTGNPQGNRTLVNECIAGHLLSRLGVATPQLATLLLDKVCENAEELYFSTERQEPIAPGLHLGSKCPVDPEKVAIFDFLPQALFSRVINLDDLGIIFAFDQWVAHVDKRQLIFARASRAKDVTSNQHNGSVFKCWVIDNGRCFGENWNYRTQSLYAHYPYLDIYSYFCLQESVGRGILLIQSLPYSEIETVCQHIPCEWFAPGEKTALTAMLGKLRQRQEILGESIRGHLDAVNRLRKRTD